MRAYFFGNFYLSSIQQGIQAAHALNEMYIKYSVNMKETDPVVIQSLHSLQSRFLEDWAKNHKTMVLLNGGDAQDLLDLHGFLDNQGSILNPNNFPYAPFYEDMPSLNGSITSVGIILPPRIYENAAIIKDILEHGAKPGYYTYTKPAVNPTDDTFFFGCSGQDGGIVEVPAFEVSFNTWEVELMQNLPAYRLAN